MLIGNTWPVAIDNWPYSFKSVVARTFNASTYNEIGKNMGREGRGTRIYILFLFCIAHSVDCLWSNEIRKNMGIEDRGTKINIFIFVLY